MQCTPQLRSNFQKQNEIGGYQRFQRTREDVEGQSKTIYNENLCHQPMNEAVIQSTYKTPGRGSCHVSGIDGRECP